MPGAEKDVAALFRLVDSRVSNWIFSQEEAEGIFLAAAGITRHVSLRTTLGLSAEFLRLMDRFSKGTDYFIRQHFVNIARNSLRINNADSFDCCTLSSLKTLFGPHMYASDELVRILAVIADIEKPMNPRWNNFQKFAYLHSRITSTIQYNDSYRDGLNISVPPYGCMKTCYDDNSMRGLLTGSTICLGYCLILGELLLRQGIENHINMHNHAFSIIKIDGKYFVLDPTQSAALLRYYGDFDRLYNGYENVDEFLAYKDHRFEMSLFPDRENPEFFMFDGDLYRDTLKHVLKIRWLDMMSHCVRYGGKTAYYAQIGTIEINGSEYIQYLYQDSDDERAMPVLVHSKANLSSFLAAIDSKDYDPEHKRLNLEIFDPANVDDSLRHYNVDLGAVYRIVKTGDPENRLDIRRFPSDTSKISSLTFAFRRKDGTLIIAIPRSIKVVPAGGKEFVLRGYRVFVRGSRNNAIAYRGYSVCTETDLSEVRGWPEKEFVANVLFGEESLIQAARERRGYAGAMRPSGGGLEVAMNPVLCEFFSSMDYPDIFQMPC